MFRPIGRVAALDLGTRRHGVAVCDELGLSVRPLGLIERVGAKRDAAALRQMLAGLDVGLLVIGLPVLDSGEEGESAARCRAEGQDLSRRLQLPFEFVDESDTTLEAQRIARERGLPANAPVDALAAAILLGDWLARRQGAGSP